MLKMPGVELELISDISMNKFIEKGMRGNKNNKYMKCYDSSEESVFIVYLDENNLYR